MTWAVTAFWLKVVMLARMAWDRSIRMWQVAVAKQTPKQLKRYDNMAGMAFAVLHVGVLIAVFVINGFTFANDTLDVP
jgi:hypothetical protein